jgi:methylated-DNA-protein-cysteine methyltransferase-like protein
VVSAGFHERVRAVVREIPSGQVATYGDVAAALGSPRVARHVGWALAALPADTEVPWHRVINAQGAISSKGDVVRAEEQRRRLEGEGVVFAENGRLTLSKWRAVLPFLAGILSGCAVTLQGIAGPVDGEVRLRTPDAEYRMVGPHAAPLSRLDGHTINVKGARSGSRINVSDWWAVEGRHGLPAWSGVITTDGAGGTLGLFDRRDKSWFSFEPDSAEALAEDLGELVIVEGWVSGNMTLHIEFWRSLTDPAPSE